MSTFILQMTASKCASQSRMTVAFYRWHNSVTACKYHLGSCDCHFTSCEPQGTLIKRHKIKDADGNFLQPSRFCIGSSVIIYSRIIHIVDADAFTRTQINALDTPALPYPADPVEDYRAAFARKTTGRLPTAVVLTIHFRVNVASG